MKIIYKDNTKKYIKWLSRKHGALSIVGANTVNMATTTIKINYKKQLHSFVLRNKFTLGSLKQFKSNPKSSSGNFRPISKINSIIGVRNMRGGKPHYLIKQEYGDTVSGLPKTKGRVPVPMDTARSSNSFKKPVKGALQLQKTSAIQDLNIGPYKLGQNDPYSNPQRWAILHKYMKNGVYGWDGKKQFLFEGSEGYGLYIYKSKKAVMVRTLQDNKMTIKATHKFSKSVNKINSSYMAKIFERQAKKYLAGDGK